MIINSHLQTGGWEGRVVLHWSIWPKLGISLSSLQPLLSPGHVASRHVLRRLLLDPGQELKRGSGMRTTGGRTWGRLKGIGRRNSWLGKIGSVGAVVTDGRNSQLHAIVHQTSVCPDIEQLAQRAQCRTSMISNSSKWQLNCNIYTGCYWISQRHVSQN